jgi:hypothetical protein
VEGAADEAVLNKRKNEITRLTFCSIIFSSKLSLFVEDA